MTVGYRVDEVISYRLTLIDGDGRESRRSTYDTRREAHEMGEQILERQGVFREREARARAQKGKWTPANLRAAIAATATVIEGGRWEVQDQGADYPGDGFDGQFKCEYYDRGSNPTYIVYCHDQPDRHGDQFSLRDPSGDRGREWTYPTADRLAAALIKRGVLS